MRMEKCDEQMMDEEQTTQAQDGPKRPPVNAVLELKIEDAAFGGDGVARHGRLVVMVRGGLPGDSVRAMVTRRKKNLLEARIVEVLEKSPHRVDAACRHFGACGGCKWQHLDYTQQLKSKENQVLEILRRIGGIEEPPLLPIIGMESPWRYRNKMEYAFYGDRQGALRLGLHSPGRFDLVINIEDCLLQDETNNGIRNFARDFCAARSLPAYHLKHHTGNLRHLVLRSARNGQSIMAIMCMAEDTFPEGAEFAAELSGKFPQIDSVMHFTSKNFGGAAVTGEGRLLHGSDKLTDEILGLKMEISAHSFTQTNPSQAARLFETLFDMCKFYGDETVLDLYSGAGPIALLASRKAARVVGIESVPDAVSDAKRNAAANDIDNVEFVCADVESVLKDIVDKEKPEIVIIDPPRAGMHAKAVTALAEARPRVLMYVSCNPATLARDASALAEAGYRLDAVRPVDMFPHTYHIECVARFVL